MESTNPCCKFVETKWIMEEHIEKKRTFGCKLFVEPDLVNGKRSDDNKRESRYEKAHLKAYLKGYPLFHFGFDKQGYPVKHPVNVVWVDVK